MKVPKALGKSFPRRLFISLFVIAYILATTVWLMAPKLALRKALMPMLSPVMLSTGLWQNFAVFSPNPRNINVHLEALVIYSDGTERVWFYPRMERLGLIDRTFKERYRKYGHDHLNWAADKKLWPDFARFVARQMNNVENARPVRVYLKRFWKKIPPPEVGLGHPMPEHDNEYLFFTYPVQPEDLQ